MSVLGVIICGISVGFFKRAAFGVDPFQSLMSGLDALIPIGFGTLYVIVNVILLSFSLINDRTKIGIATFINLFLLGYIVEFSHKFLLQVFPALGMTGRIVIFLIGILTICCSSSLYFTANLGVSTYDAVALLLNEKWHVASFKVCRVGTDLCCVIIGVVLFLTAGGTFKEIGALIGVGTILTAFFMGPLIEFFNVHVSQPLLNK